MPDKGKDERGVGYVKHNAIAGRSFASWAALEAHLAWWMREVADVRIHGTTGEAPVVRFERDEAAALRPLGNRASFGQLRELTRRVQNDGCIDVDTNHYSVPLGRLCRPLLRSRIAGAMAAHWRRGQRAGVRRRGADLARRC